MRIDFRLAAIVALLAASPAPAQESAKLSSLKAQLRTLPNLNEFLQGDESSARRFADAAFDQPGSQTREWTLFDSLLAGGKLDRGGAQIRAELKKLPPEQWYYVIRLEDHRRSLSELSDGWYGNMLQGTGNLFVGKKDELHVLKCHEQAETLMRNMAPVKTTGRPASIFQHWASELVTAKFRWPNEHNAPCFHYDGPEGPVEFVADSWAGDLVPARVWWRKWDADVLTQLSGKSVCGKSYEQFDDARIAVLMERDRKQDAYLEAAKKRLSGFLPSQ